ncbi:hypothetical protein MKX01_008260 [Papaver californicum]|nr:hypothetical protein MKX01_002435 [Papaver californicum]KAI3956741.1 hypothetical protein MKX01_008260 [Papaver californicum]
MAITASSRKRGRKPKDTTPPEPKKTKIKDEKAEPSGDGMNLDTKTSKSSTETKKTIKGKGKAVESDSPEIETKTARKDKGKAVDTEATSVAKKKSSVVTLKNTKSIVRKGKKKFLNEEEEEDEEVSDLEILNPEEAVDEDENESAESSDGVLAATSAAKRKITKSKKENGNSECRLTGKPVPIEEATQRWPDRYKAAEGGADFLHVRQHYTSAEVDGVTFYLNDCCLIKAEEGQLDYIGRIVEFFETVKKKPYIAVKWFFRAVDTVIQVHSDKIEPKRVFSSDSRDDNPLDCIVSKVLVVQASIDVPGCDFFYDMKYSEKYCTFESLCIENEQGAASSSSTISSEGSSRVFEEKKPALTCESGDSVMTLLDMYAGCGGMSTGLCMGAAASDINLVTRWAVDFNADACESLGYNHPETEVRHMKAEDFFQLLLEWRKLCDRFSLLGTNYSKTKLTDNPEIEETEEEAQQRPPDENDEYEVEKIIGITYDINPDTMKGPAALHFKVKWKGWGSDWDSWEPASGLNNCEECIEEFVTEGYKSHILPLPGTVDVICGGPPCQGISGFNRFRNYDEPLKDPKNFQLVVFMDIVEYLQPKFTLMENVVDIMRFLDGTLGRFAIARLVAMHYQVRLGLLVAGSYGLPQYRMRAFLWGAKTTEKLPQFPVPTHKVIGRGHAPKAFENNLVKGDEEHMLTELLLKDAISDLPAITTHEKADEREYGDDPITDFQRKIRLPKHELMVSAHCPSEGSVTPKLYDHRPLKLSDDDNIRVSKIPRRKGANYRDLPGVKVDASNHAYRDPEMDIVYIENSKKPLVPEYAIKFVRGTSKKPFGRLWWDEIVSTVVTRAEPHNQIILHPEQDRVLSVRENARLQGFPDYYRLFGTIKQRYTQVGNAVAVPVGKALGFALSSAVHKTSDDGQIFELPPSFSR